jgi:hypothetical protein
MADPNDVAKAHPRARIVSAQPGGGLTRDQARSRRKREVGKVTENLRRLPKYERVHLRVLTPDLTPDEEALRPKTRGDCADGLRPCPWVSCRYHLFLDVQANGNLTLHFPDLEVEQLAETCALDVAEHGGETLEAVGELCNVTRERIRQVEGRAMFRIQKRAPTALRELVGDEGRRPTRALTRTGRRGEP